MAAPSFSQQRRGVFLNVPYEPGYEPMFIAMVVCVVCARLVPRCAIQFPERGDGQLRRIMKLLGTCRLSIHDLSRPGRFNLPFELGLAVALHDRRKHEFIVCEVRRDSLRRNFSDLRGIEPLVHENNPARLIAGLADNLGVAKPAAVESIYHQLMPVVPGLKRACRTKDAFQKTIFNELVSGAIELAKSKGVFD